MYVQKVKHPIHVEAEGVKEKVTKKLDWTAMYNFNSCLVYILQL